MVETQQFATFYLDRLLFGVEVKQVQEVIRFQEMTRVPLAPAVIRGLINLRGQIVTAVDLRRRLGLSELEPSRLPMNVVVRTVDGAVSLLVDEIGDVVEVSADAFECPPETVTGATRDLIRGVYKMSDGLLRVLDTQRAVQVGGDAADASRAVALDAADDAPIVDAPVPAASLFERLGGRPALEAVIDALYERILADDELADFFGATDIARLKRQQADFLGQAFGGPAIYRGASMQQAHAGMGVRGHHFDRVAGHLGSALEALGVREDLAAEVLGIAGSLKKQIVAARAA
jgi:purine-binding chemotaxis protein CheW